MIHQVKIFFILACTTQKQWNLEGVEAGFGAQKDLAKRSADGSAQESNPMYRGMLPHNLCKNIWYLQPQQVKGQKCNLM